MLDSLLDGLRDYCSFISRDPLLKFIEVFEADYLIGCQQLSLLFAELIKVSDTSRINLISGGWPHSPDLTELLQERKFAIALQVLQLGHLALRKELFDLLLDALAHEWDCIHLVSIRNRLGVSFDVADCALIPHDLTLLVRLGLVDVHQFGELSCDIRLEVDGRER